MKTLPKPVLAWIVAATFTFAVSGVWAQDAPTSQETAAGQHDAAVEANAASETSEAAPASEADLDAHADHHSPSLGVLVGSCPGQGVCVHDTIWGSPAERVGIQAGDYILAVNDQPVSTPQELKERIDSLKATDSVKLSVWRRGQRVTKEVALASEAKALLDSRRAWMGVMLSDRKDGESGVVISDVYPDSPAERGGLHAGDIVVKMGDTEVTSINQFVTLVKDVEPGAKVDLTLRRGDDEQQITVEVGQVDNAPLRWFRRSLGPFGPFNRGFQRDLAPLLPMEESDVMFDGIDDLRAQLRSLREEVDQLKQQLSPSTDHEPQQKEEQPANKNLDDDLSKGEARQSDFVQLVVQQDGRFPNRGHRERGDRANGDYEDGDRSYRNRGDYQRPYNLPHLSNDWTRERYRYQNDRTNRYRYPIDQPYPYRSPYSPVYRYPFTPYPTYPYGYYFQGGRPYYYGYGYPYGYRGGIQIGPNAAVHW
ncbi:putative periplasmic serine endoprotease DegP-like precursor [Novipirellula galeiformis]|uniref:Putative periplasmic serine endoprotease DegP-like n=1 Tax=Novipirellula galeiformis TaxID=2528004 RepID=A0A5C6CLK1_9BACT|nr:PDZ domain-containing protein [Novipirellula galeiformis]TWU24955.1 putative periplasmic serine endoprotease DegP-like precursor [Novipirellula galeiformis]